MREPTFRTAPAVRGFERSAEAYERGRPGYPASVARHLARALRLGPRRTVVELGSGTGKFTRTLVPVGCAIVAVEPTAGMRRVFERTVPDIPVLPGTAEAIPLPDGLADAVVAAQAFQWFRPRPAMEEIARVLRPGGGLGLVWNVRDESVGWMKVISRILGRYNHAPQVRERRWKAAFRAKGVPFPPPRMRRISHVQRATPSEVLDRFLSVSSIAILPAADRRKVATEIRELLRSDPMTRGRSYVDLPYDTEVYWTRLKR
ncbi:MAG: class I SAM-dependent methyltransferase [Thermoplasmata archaeon]